MTLSANTIVIIIIIIVIVMIIIVTIIITFFTMTIFANTIVIIIIIIFIFIIIIVLLLVGNVINLQATGNTLHTKFNTLQLSFRSFEMPNTAPAAEWFYGWKL